MNRRNPHQKMTHQLIAATAKEMAGAWYEDAAHDNDFYHFYPKQKMFINREWHRFVEMARQHLSAMLGRHDVEEWKKEQIFDALIKHASIPGNIDPRVAKKVIDMGNGNIAMVH